MIFKTTSQVKADGNSEQFQSWKKTAPQEVHAPNVKRCKAKCGWQNLKAVFIRSNKTWEIRQTQVDTVNTGTSVT